jgi:hypothetical protein
MSDSISKRARVRGIKEILHFSTNRGLTGCLYAGYVYPRSKLKTEDKIEHILTLNAPFRAEEEHWFDRTERWIDYVNLSISEITANLFRFSLKWHAGKDIYWIIMSFDPVLLDDDGVYFSTTNNIYEHTNRAKGVVGFDALFAPVVRRKGAWVANRGTRASNLPTCEQAEVLYPAGLDMRYLRRVYVREAEQKDRVHALLSEFERLDVEIFVDVKKFQGCP